MTRILSAQALKQPGLPHVRVQDLPGRLTLVVLMLALWMAAHPYLGIIGDARFYNVQILRFLSPQNFGADLYFKYGSQDDYSIFTPMCAWAIRAFGLNLGNIFLNTGFQALWLSGAWWLVRGLVRDQKMAVLALAGAIVMPGGVSFVHYGDQLLTPRLLAEALTLWGLGTMLRGRPLAALAVLVASLSIHPLMTLPGLGVWFLYLSARRRVLWIAAMLGAAIILGLAELGVPPFVRLTQTFDPAWLSVANVRDAFCFLRNWEVSDWLKICNIFALTVAGLALAPQPERRFLAASSLVAVVGLASSIIFGDRLHLVLFVGLQLWRTVWLLSFVANLCFILGAIRLAQPGRLSPTSPFSIYALAGIFLAASRFTPSTLVLVAPVAILGLLVHLWERYRRAPMPSVGRVAAAVCLGVACVLGLFAVRASLQIIAVAPASLYWTGIGFALVCICLVAISLEAGAPTNGAPSRLLPAARFCLALGLLAVALAAWDQRQPWRRFVETQDQPSASLNQLVSGGGAIYWEGDVAVPWLLLKRSSYFSCEQGTGVLFNRGTAIAYQQRFENFQELGTLDFWRETFCPGTRNRLAVPLTRADLKAVCEREPELGELVLARPVTDDPGKSWAPPARFEDFMRTGAKITLFSADQFHAYACADYRPH